MNPERWEMSYCFYLLDFRLIINLHESPCAIIEEKKMRAQEEISKRVRYCG